MADVTSGIEIKNTVPNGGTKIITVTTANTVDDGDTFTVTLSNYGINIFNGIVGFIHTTEGSVVVQEQPTTSVSSGVLTVTVGGSTDDKKRVYVIYGE